MAKKKTVFIVEDDAVSSKKLEKLFEQASFDVHCFHSPLDVENEINTHQPDLIMLDIMMPGLDGLELTRRIRKNWKNDKVKIAVISSKSYESDRRRALDLGADIFIPKPFQRDDLDEIKNLLSDKSATINFWGVRGTLPVPGENTIEFGGNTSCVSVKLSNDQLIVFDAGSGAKNLADHLVSQKEQVKAHYYISHAHWDHINGLPFFTPLYMAGNIFDLYGPINQDISFKNMISGQMDSIYFPITIETFAANINYHDLTEGTVVHPNYKMHTKLLNHPGNCLGYRIEFDDLNICYVTDNELRDKGGDDFDEPEYNRLVNFVHGADVLITDSTYTNEEYQLKKGWGHSSVDQVVHLAHDAKVKNLCLFHHDPDQLDEDITRKHDIAIDLLNKLSSHVNCICPRENEELTVTAKGIKTKNKKSAA